MSILSVPVKNPLSEDLQRKYNDYYNNLSAERKAEEEQWLFDALTQEIDRECCREDWKKTPEDEITDADVEKWRQERVERNLAIIKEYQAKKAAQEAK